MSAVELPCDVAQASLSALADGEAPDVPATAITAHVEGCARCQAFDATVRDVRQRLRFEPVGDLPDLTDAILARVDARRPRDRRWLAVAAAVLVGAITGASFVGFDTEPASVAAADLPARVVAAQRSVDTLSATVTVSEAGGRSFRGTLRYRAPESLAIILPLTPTDLAGTALVTVADGDRFWVSGPRRCAPPAPSPCAPPTTRAVELRAPFVDDAVVPLELIAPVDSLALAAPQSALGHRDIDGAAAVGIEVPAGQVSAIFDGLDPTGALRELHPTDTVELWLDEHHLVPLELTVRAGALPERRRWAAAHGYDDAPGAVLLTVGLTDVEINGDLEPGSFPAPPAGTAPRNGGFFEADGVAGDAPTPGSLPVGFRPHRAGLIDHIAVRTWSDGRAWLAVRATTGWAGNRLFGDLGPAVAIVDLGDAGIGYRSADGTAIAIHASGLDLVVTGSIEPGALRRAAASLGVVGVPVPATWAEAATATLARALVAAPDLLVPNDLDGFGPPAIRVAGGTVTISHAGPGTRSFELIRTELAVLPPPFDPGAVAVTVRGVPGRYTAERGDLEWVEGGHVRILRSRSLGAAELLAIAERLVAA